MLSGLARGTTGGPRESAGLRPWDSGAPSPSERAEQEPRISRRRKASRTEDDPRRFTVAWVGYGLGEISRVGSAHRENALTGIEEKSRQGRQRLDRWHLRRPTVVKRRRAEGTIRPRTSVGDPLKRSRRRETSRSSVSVSGISSSARPAQAGDDEPGRGKVRVRVDECREAETDRTHL